MGRRTLTDEERKEREAARRRAYRQANLEKVRARERANYAKRTDRERAADRERYNRRPDVIAKRAARALRTPMSVKEQRQRYYLKNRARIRARQLAYSRRPDVRERTRERMIEYSAKNYLKLRAWAQRRNRERPGYRLWLGAKRRAAELGLPFTITEADIRLPSHCPVLGLRLEHGRGRVQYNSPTLDRIVPELGYTKANVLVVSHRANAIKTNTTPDQILRVGQFSVLLHRNLRYAYAGYRLPGKPISEAVKELDMDSLLGR
jgi:hypothetical protein